MSHSDRDAQASLGAHPVTVSEEMAVQAVELTHSEVRALLTAYVDGTLLPAEQVRVRAHLARCEPCRAFLATFKQAVQVVGQLPPHRLRSQAKRRIVEQLKGEQAKASA